MPTSSPAPAHTASPVYRVLGAISFSHLLNDMMQSMLVAIYPLLRSDFQLTFAQVGMITLTFQITASLLQPLIGAYTDKHSKPYSLAFGMGATFIGLLILSQATSFPLVLLAAALVGSGSAVFHPESSRVARLASGGQFGLAQAIFQVGGNLGAATGPLLAAWLILPRGQGAIAWVSLAALLAMTVLVAVGRWYSHQHRLRQASIAPVAPSLPKKLIARSMIVLLALMFSKFFYSASLTSYLIFYLMHHFALSAADAQYYLFYYLAAVASGTVFGGLIGDRVGRRTVIWVSILGVAPFTIAMPYASLEFTALLTMIAGFFLASAFPSMLVYAQELIPGKVGTIAGLFFGLAFGLGGIGAAILGHLADHIGIEAVYQLCSYLPLIGVVAFFLPKIHEHGQATQEKPSLAAANSVTGS